MDWLGLLFTPIKPFVAHPERIALDFIRSPDCVGRTGNHLDTQFLG
jgi:hypothetical protein